MLTAIALDVQENFDKHLQLVQAGEEVIVLKDGVEVVRMISRDKSVSFLADALTEVLQGDYDDKSIT